MGHHCPKIKPELAVLKRASKIQADPNAVDSLEAEYALLAEKYRSLVARFYKTITISDAYQAQIKELTNELERTTVKFRRLRDVALPICVHCHKVYVGDEYWQQLETFLIQNLDILFSQGLCPDCLAAMRTNLGEPPAESTKVPVAPRHQMTMGLTEDKVAGELQELADRAAREESPLAGDIARAAKNYTKLARRFLKTVTISDSFQSQLRGLNTQLEIMARTDLLTGFVNRWEMISRIDAERTRALRHGHPLAVILGDIDFFKNINDTFGHLSGDKVLRKVSEVLRNSLRHEDTCARWGGEEFLFLLPETNIQQAKIVAEKLRNAIHHLKVESEGNSINLTMSFGIGTFSSDMTVDACLKLIDDALYCAKAAGRNQVAVASEGNI